LVYIVLEWVLDLQFDNVDFALDYKVIDQFRTYINDNCEFGCIVYTL